ncbi:MAG: transposase [Desulfobacteraceae bacterium]|nr:transposase [Desulfobacteraceae bacterium]
MKRIVVPGYPHHIVQRGVRSMDVIFKEEDRVEYLSLLKEKSLRFGVTYISYCLMTNHIHLLAVPEKEDSLAKAVGEAHRRYTRIIILEKMFWGFFFRGVFHHVLCLQESTCLLQFGILNKIQQRQKLLSSHGNINGQALDFIVERFRMILLFKTLRYSPT